MFKIKATVLRMIHVNIPYISRLY